MSRSRTLVRVLLPCAVLFATLGPALPAAAEAPWSGMRVGPVYVDRDGDRYRVDLRVEEMEGWGSVDVSVRRTADPDGDGPIHSVQKHTWSMVEVQNILSVSPRLRYAGLSTGSKLDPFATADYHFRATSPTELYCSGGRRVRRGSVTGKLVLRTHTRLGAIEVRDAPAWVWTSNNRCPYFGPLEPDPCVRMEGIGGSRDGFHVGASWPVRGKRARISVERWRELSLDRSEAYAYVTHEILTRVPRDHVWLGEKMRRGGFRGAAGTFTTRRATFAATDDQIRDGGSNFCYRNGTKYESTGLGRRGTVSGTLKANFDIGKDFELGDRPLRGSAGRSTVRPV